MVGYVVNDYVDFLFFGFFNELFEVFLVFKVFFYFFVVFCLVVVIGSVFVGEGVDVVVEWWDLYYWDFKVFDVVEFFNEVF